MKEGFPGSSADKESACNEEDLGSISGLGRSLGEEKDYPLQYSGLENSTDYIVHGVANSPDTTERLTLMYLYTFQVYVKSCCILPEQFPH